MGGFIFTMCRFTEKNLSPTIGKSWSSHVGDAFNSFKFIRLKNLGTFIAGRKNSLYVLH